MSISTFAKDLDRALRKMDAEATTLVNGVHAGLVDYGRHFTPHLKRPRPECCWSQRLAELFNENGYHAKPEVPYPGQRKKCDNVIRLNDGSTLWLENKGAWKEYWRTKSEWIYRSYLLHPLVEGLDAKSHTVPLDVEKLSKVRPSDAQHVGILLIGFDSDVAPMDDDIRELCELSPLGTSPWTLGGSASWPDRGWPGCNVRYWFWHRPVR